MCQARTCGRVLARARVQVLQNFTTLSARDFHWWNPRKKNYRECSNIKSARVSALTGSAPGKWPRRGRAFQHSSGIEPRIEGIESMSPDSLPLASTTKPLCHIKCWKKTVYDLSYFATCNRIFCIQDCRSRHNFCSMLIEQLVDLEKVRTDKLKFRTDLRDWVMDGWSVTQ